MSAGWPDSLPEAAVDWPEAKAPTLSPVSFAELLERKFPPREMVLGPWLPVKGLAMIYAPRGVGKTWVALNIAWAVATGGKFLRWQALTPRKVIYVDGEMPGGTMQERLVAIAGGDEPEAPDYFRVVSSDLEEFGVPDLSTRAGQKALDAVLAGAGRSVLVILSSLGRSGR